MENYKIVLRIIKEDRNDEMYNVWKLEDEISGPYYFKEFYKPTVTKIEHLCNTDKQVSATELSGQKGTHMNVDN